MKQEVLKWDSGDGEVDVSITISRATLQMGLDRNRLLAAAQRYLREIENRYLKWLTDPKRQEEDQDKSVESVSDTGADEEYGMWLVCNMYYPCCLAGTVKIENAKDSKVKLSKSMSIPDFLELDEQLVAEWVNIALALNPHWNMFANRGDTEQGETKAPVTESGSTDKS